jgi:hypothetical protein
MKTITRVFSVGFLLITFTLSAHAAIISYPTDTLTTNPDNIVVTSSDGVVVTAYGYQAELTSVQDQTAAVHGPFPTTLGDRSRQIFGADTRSTREGLGLHAQPTGAIAPSENDVGTALVQPGFDNSPIVGSFPEIQFSLFTFSQSVDVSQAIIGTQVGSGSIWVAGGSGAVPDLTTDFLGLLTTLGTETSLDMSGGTVLVHDLATLINVDYILLGTTPRVDNFGPLTGIDAMQFFINGLNLAPTTVPIPPAVWLFGSGLLGLIGVARRKKA